MAVVRLENPIRPYAWGSTEAIPQLLGVEPDGRPWAEMWIGAHPASPSRSEDGRPLTELVAADPPAVLGAGVARAFDDALPFLFKVLAAARPLSIQCHPDAEQARAGFAREEAAGIPRDAPERSYRDDSHKPELVVALSPFFALKGFREPAEIAALVAAAGVATLAAETRALARSGDLRAFFAALVTLPEDRLAAALAELAANLGDAPEHRWVRRLLTLYPGDAGCFAPLVLNLVELAPGEALYLPARELHAYLEGTALEIMASSDNVLRGGLTGKHVDVPELLRVLDFRPGAPAVLTPRPGDDGLSRYETPAREFSLAVAEPGSAPLERAGRRGVEILLCTDGHVELTAGAESARLRRGESLLVPAAVPAYRLAGPGRVHIASVGRW